MYHHTIGVGESLQARGVDVLLHTAVDAEKLDDDVPRCRCLDWSRRPPSGVRQPITATRFLTRTCPHLVRSVGEHDVAHVQGLYGNQLTAWLIDRLVRAGRPVAFSPHNTFARSGRRIDESTIRWMARRADVTIAFSDDDADRLREWGANVAVADLVHHVPTPTEAERVEWNDRFDPGPVALLAGQVRADKRPDVFIQACRIAGVTPAIVGPASDGEELVRESARGIDVIRVDDYLPLSSFVAAVAASDVVVATHRVGSVSGPLAYAGELGVRSVAPAVGGLAERVTAAIDGDDAAAAALAIEKALAGPPPPRRHFDAVAQQHLDAYRRAGWTA